MILDILIKLLTENNIEVITEAIINFCIYYKITKVNINKAYLDKHRNRLVIKLKVYS